jgi:hypothetical protein
MHVQPASLDTMVVTYHRLHRQMLEVLDLRAKVASLEKARSRNRQRAKKARDLRLERVA